MLKCCFLTASKFVKVGIFVMDNEYQLKGYRYFVDEVIGL